MSDLTFIRDLRVRVVIGVTPEERRAPQDVLINVAFESDQTKAGESDEFADAVDYRALNKRLLRVAEERPHHLVESLAARLAKACLEDARVESVRVRVEKPGALRFADSVGVEIVRRRERA